MSKFFLNIIIFIMTFLFITSKKKSKLTSKNIFNTKNDNKLFRNLDNSINNKNETIISCNVKNCYQCDKTNKCIECKNNYKLLNNHCYNTNCQIFGFCNYCDEFDCIQCIKGYQLNFGTCDKTVDGFKKKLIFFVLVPILIISTLLYLYIYYKKKNKTIIETGKVINLKHPKPGNYIILPETLREEQSTESFSKSSNITHTYESTNDSDINDCIVCGKKKIYAFGDCGCGLCKDHWKYIKNPNNEKIMCRKHGTQLRSIIFSLDNKSNLKGNAVEKLGLKKCPICKMNNGTQSFNCKCNMKLCDKCFNEYVYILNYNNCPGCGMVYNPSKDKSSGFRFGKKKIKDDLIEEEIEVDKECTKNSGSKLN